MSPVSRGAFCAASSRGICRTLYRPRSPVHTPGGARPLLGDGSFVDCTEIGTLFSCSSQILLTWIIQTDVKCFSKMENKQSCLFPLSVWFGFSLRQPSCRRAWGAVAGLRPGGLGGAGGGHAGSAWGSCPREQHRLPLILCLWHLCTLGWGCLGGGCPGWVDVDQSSALGLPLGSRVPSPVLLASACPRSVG